MKWTDVFELAVELAQAHPDVDPRYVNFVDLRDWIVELEAFDDDRERCSERLLEAIQSAWIEETD